MPVQFVEDTLDSNRRANGDPDYWAVPGRWASRVKLRQT